MPANIRFQHYADEDHLKFENKFAPVGVTIPLCKDMNEACKVIPKVTHYLRNVFLEVYAMYAFLYWTSMFSPYFM